MKKIICLVLALVMMSSMVLTTFATEEEIVVLFTNDVHTYIDDVYNASEEEKDAKLSYSKLAQLKKDLLAEGKNVLLADCGDFSQGTAYGSIDQGETIRKIFEAVGYDIATIGNHEFDYGLEGAIEYLKNSSVPFVSCNFTDLKTGEKVLDAYKILEIGGRKIAFVGITTIETVTTTSSQKSFKDENGEYIYGFCSGDNGKELYEAVQTAVDSAKAEGADYVIALSHCGDGDYIMGFRGEDVIANTTGIDVMLEGHDHEQKNRSVNNKEGKEVLYAEAGSYLKAIGKLTIAKNGTVSVEFVDSYKKEDSEIKAMEEAWISDVDTQLGEVIGYAEITLDNYNGEERLVRKMETNTADFATDAIYYYFNTVMGLDIDVAMVNGGGVRNKAVTGPINYKVCRTIHAFGNIECLITVTGRQILEALEYGARALPDSENGGFLQVSGLRYDIHSYLPYNETTADTWQDQDTSKFRVKDVEIYDKESGLWVPLDLEKEYNLGGNSYTFREGGDGFYMFEDAVPVADYVIQDYLSLATYIKSFPLKEQVIDGKTVSLPTVSEKYADLYGEGRITVYTEQPEFTITYDNGVEGATALYGEAFTVTDAVLEQKGYKFIGWATEEGATVSEYVAGDTVSANGDIVLYAVWQKTVNPAVFVGVAVVLVAVIVVVAKKKKK